MNKLPDHYRIKYKKKGTNCRWKYGIFERYGEDVEGYWKQGKCIISDAVLPITTLYKYDDLTIVDIKFGNTTFDIKTNRLVPGDEFDQYIQDEFDKAKAVSKKAKGLVGKMFSISVADGYAHYVVVRENKKTVRVQWRGFGMDRYTDAILGWECTVEKERIASRIHQEEGLAKLFAEARAGK